MALPPKAVSVLCLLQIFFVLVGYLLTRACLRFYDQYVVLNFGHYAPRIPRVSDFMREYGLFLLLVPVGWCVFVCIRGAMSGEISAKQALLGLAFTVGLMTVSWISGYQAYMVAFHPLNR